MENKRKIYGRIIAVRRLKNNIFVKCYYQNRYVQLRLEQNEKAKGAALHKGNIIYGLGEWEISSKNIKTFRMDTFDIREASFGKMYGTKVTFNKEQLKVITIKSLMYNGIRAMLLAKGYVEVTTPILQSQKGSTGAYCFEVVGEKSCEKFYLRRNSEMNQKKIIANTLMDIFEFEVLCRDQGRSRTTMKEYQMLDIYKVGEDYEYSQKLLLDIMEHSIDILVNNNIGIPEYLKHKIHRYEFIQLINNYFGRDMYEDSSSNLKIVLNELELPEEINENISYYSLLEKVYSLKIKPTIDNAIIFHFPSDQAPLAKKVSGTPFAEEWKYVINGVSIGHSYTEETNYDVVSAALIKQVNDNSSRLELEKDLLDVINYGLPECVGIGIGLNRLLCAVCNINNVRNTTTY